MKLIVLKNNVPFSEVLVETPDSSEQYEFFVGRADDCHVLIDDPLISRHHLVIKNQGPQWFCEKLTTLGVVTVNGDMSARSPIQQGSEIKCGIYSILIAQLSPTGRQPSETVTSAFSSTQSYRPDLQTNQSSTESNEPEVESGTGLVIDELSSLDNSEESLSNETPASEEMLQDDYLNSNDDLANTDVDSQSIASEDSLNSEMNTGSDLSGDQAQADFNSTEENLPTEFDGEAGVSASEFDDEDNKTRFDNFFVNYQLVLFGEHAPYDRYTLSLNETFIGRDEKKCQIILNDPEVSSVHAVLRKTKIDVILEDINSSNGTILNGERINRAHLSPGDEFVIGGTSFTLEVVSDLLDAEKDRLMPVEAGQTIETEEIEEEIVDLENSDDLNFDANTPVEKSIIKRIWKDPQKRRKAIIYLVVATLLAVVFLPDEEEAPPVVKTAPVKEAAKTPAKVKLSSELENRRNIAYELGVSFFEQNKYFEALKEFQTVAEIDSTYKNIQTYLEQTKTGLKRLEELEAERRAEEERIKTKKIIEELLVKTRAAVKDHNITVANSLFSQITEKDPENIEVSQLKLELEAWQREEERKALELAAKQAARKAMVDALSPGKTFYLKKEWYRAIMKIEEFLRKKGMDEDLVKEGSDMLSDAKNQLASELGPLLGKARSLKEGQDLKNAYEAFLEVLKIEPTNTEALNEVDDIRSQLDSRSKKIYREAIIAESLSLFSDAKEKFQEVQQISPTDSDYYKKASEKLKNYLE